MSESVAKEKCFLDYDQQIQRLLDKKLIIDDVENAKEYLKVINYYSLISGYKDIFKDKSTNDYKRDMNFNNILALYRFDELLREIYFRCILKVERHIKSLYSYTFTERFGFDQKEYLNVNNYNYVEYQNEINETIAILRNIIDKQSDKYDYVKHHKDRYDNVPLWVLVNTLTLGNVSKIYQYSVSKIQIKIAKEFTGVYKEQLASMLNVLSKFRNVCAHNERLYNYKIKQKAIRDLEIHKKLRLEGYGDIGKSDLFGVTISFKYLLNKNDFEMFIKVLSEALKEMEGNMNTTYYYEILEQMGFPKNWKEIIDLVDN